MERLKKVADKDRFSVLVDNLDECLFCKQPHPHKHEVFFGNKRELSKSYGYVVPLCYKHHETNEGPHGNREIDLQLKQVAQEHFEEHNGTREDFIRIFGKSYL